MLIMKIFHLLNLAFLTLSALACSNVESKPVINTIVEAPAEEPVELPDVQTLADNHQILLIRVAGNLNKVSEGTKSKLSAQTESFNAAYEQLKMAIKSGDELRAKLKTLKEDPKKTAQSSQAIAQTITALNAANATAVQLKDQYDEAQRQFVVLIEAVKNERAKQ
jgi:hypothetical protein